VKDKEVAKKMTKFIELNTIGVSKDSQLRAAKVLRAVSDSWEQGNSQEGESFFKFSHKLMANRWKQLRLVVEHSELFSLPKFSPSFCTFFKEVLEPQPGTCSIHHKFDFMSKCTCIHFFFSIWF